MLSISRFTTFAMTTLSASVALAATPSPSPSYGSELQGFDYPYPLHHYKFRSQGSDLQMSYMDVDPTGHANGHTAVLLHGKNYCGATWESQIAALASAGYRVVVPDQIGFCASSKPDHYQYSFVQLAANTNALLQQLGIDKATLVAHSTGGMLAVRYALIYPQAVEQMTLVNPVGLEGAWRP
jgi:pimeloyl-ACP methyl ester carboxylesterase